MVYFITFLFVLLDIISGLIKSIKENDYKSYKMRQGLYHKCGIALCVIFGTLVDFSQKFIDIGVTIPVATSICTYIILMEVGSIIENICSINPDILPIKIQSYFKMLNGDDKNDVHN